MTNKFENYLVDKNDTISKVLKVFQYSSDNSLPTGIAVIVNKEKQVTGVISEGDIRRAIINGKMIDDEISDIYIKNPICLNHKLSFNEILNLIPQELSKRNRKSKKFLSNIILTDHNNKFRKVFRIKM